MAKVNEYSEYDAVGLAALIRQGEVKASEVHEAAVAAAADIGGKLGALTEGPFMQESDANPDGELAGVPFVAKDLLIQIRGVAGHGGSGALADVPPATEDSVLMSRFREAGLDLVATTKSPEFGLSVATDQKWQGSARNPWDTDRGPGGSSGGSAALVAAGVVPIGHANDGAGSIRIPAGHTGLVGLKPSRGRVPLGPGQQESMYGNVVEFAMTRSVRDTAHLLDLVHGNAPGEKYGAPVPRRRYRDEIVEGARNTGPLRIAVSTAAWSGVPVDPAVQAGIARTATVLTELGHIVEWQDPPLDWEQFASALTTTWCAGTAAAVIPLLDAGADPTAFEATTLTCAEAGRSVTPMVLAEAFATNNLVSRCLGAFLRSWDVWLSPTSLAPAPPVGTFDANNPAYSAADWVRKCINPYPTLSLFNVSGGPAITVPVAENSSGLPIGVHLGADLYREDVLLLVAAELERAMPWASRRPPIHVNPR
ncbi:amidase [Rhodococcus rhodochrous]|uniref:amidase n=1 Tax=Rhodococcus rhodochrous TaxID=1829 RepID=UPI000D0613D5|nr:amidase family protein [Rhodococcus rhodochrous]AYA23253.1 amidase [Rhodococcus rhodochrous]